ncbi:MAG: hypothetical protein WAV01_02040 [Candidatus Saccharimonadales bacterium]
MKLTLLILACLAIVGFLDYQATNASESFTNEMHAIWNEEAASGVPIEDRTGWPD